MNRLDEPFALPSGISGTYEELKAKFNANEITDKQDLKELKRQAQKRFESYTAGVIGSFIYYDLEVSDLYDAYNSTLDNTLMRVMVEYLRGAAVIKGDDVVVKLIDKKLSAADDYMLERCELEKGALAGNPVCARALKAMEYER